MTGPGSGARSGRPDERTVQGILEAALSQLAGRETRAELAGRTDRGVHRGGQVASCDDIRPAMSPEATGRRWSRVSARRWR